MIGLMSSIIYVYRLSGIGQNSTRVGASWYHIKHVVYIYKGSLCVHAYLCVCVCPLITRERVTGLSPNFQGSFRAPRGWFMAKKLEGKNLEEW